MHRNKYKVLFGPMMPDPIEVEADDFYINGEGILIFVNLDGEEELKEEVAAFQAFIGVIKVNRGPDLKVIGEK